MVMLSNEEGLDCRHPQKDVTSSMSTIKTMKQRSFMMSQSNPFHSVAGKLLRYLLLSFAEVFRAHANFTVPSIASGEIMRFSSQGQIYFSKCAASSGKCLSISSTL
jgi:hypothetical protein